MNNKKPVPLPNRIEAMYANIAIFFLLRDKCIYKPIANNKTELTVRLPPKPCNPPISEAA